MITIVGQYFESRCNCGQTVEARCECGARLSVHRYEVATAYDRLLCARCFLLSVHFMGAQLVPQMRVIVQRQLAEHAMLN